MSVTIIGQTSFLAQAVKAIAPESWHFLSHKEALKEDGWLEHSNTVINFAFPPEFKSTDYLPASDIDSKLARKLANNGIHYIMLSSRLVYGRNPNGFELDEKAACKPDTPYGKAKQKTEQALQDILPSERLTILRLSNVFGYEPGRSTFFGRAMSALAKKGEIIFDISPFAVRDFLPAGIFAQSLVAIAEKPKGGTFNLGAGFGIECGLVAEGLIEGFGSGELRVSQFSRADQFWLDIGQARNQWQIPTITAADLYQKFTDLGRLLKESRA